MESNPLLKNELRAALIVHWERSLAAAFGHRGSVQTAGEENAGVGLTLRHRRRRIPGDPVAAGFPRVGRDRVLQLAESPKVFT